MARPRGSVKHLQINKANTQVLIIAGLAGFLTVMSLVFSQAYLSQNKYLDKVNNKKKEASVQLHKNLDAVEKLSAAYNNFQSRPINVIGGSATGEGQNDGPNSKIVLDALPTSYDFPALTASIEKILTDRKLKVDSITGTDDELAQVDAASSPDPQAVPMAFTFTISGANYDSIQDVMKALTQSIRPVQVDSFTITGGNSDMKLDVAAHTFYQPPKNLSIKKEAVQP